MPASLEERETGPSRGFGTVFGCPPGASCPVLGSPWKAQAVLGGSHASQLCTLQGGGSAAWVPRMPGPQGAACCDGCGGQWRLWPVAREGPGLSLGSTCTQSRSQRRTSTARVPALRPGGGGSAAGPQPVTRRGRGLAGQTPGWWFWWWAGLSGADTGWWFRGLQPPHVGHNSSLIGGRATATSWRVRDKPVPPHPNPPPTGHAAEVAGPCARLSLPCSKVRLSGVSVRAGCARPAAGPLPSPGLTLPAKWGCRAPPSARPD